MKNLLLILVTISILSCTKKQDDPKPVVTTTQKQSNPVSSCNKDSSWTRTHSTVKSVFTFYETCTTLTITYKSSGQTVTVTKPTGNSIVTNWKDLGAFNSNTSSSKFYYHIYYGVNAKRIIYDVKDANSGVGGSGMKIN